MCIWVDIFVWVTLAEQGLLKAHEKVEDLYKVRHEEINKGVARALARFVIELGWKFAWLDTIYDPVLGLWSVLIWMEKLWTCL